MLTFFFFSPLALEKTNSSSSPLYWAAESIGFWAREALWKAIGKKRGIEQQNMIRQAEGRVRSKQPATEKQGLA